MAKLRLLPRFDKYRNLKLTKSIRQLGDCNVAPNRLTLFRNIVYFKEYNVSLLCLRGIR